MDNKKMYFHIKETANTKNYSARIEYCFHKREVMHMSHFMVLQRDKSLDLGIFPVVEKHGPLYVGIRIRSRRGNAPIIY